MATIFCFQAWLAVLLLFVMVSGNPEQGKWTFELNKDKQFAAVAKHMFKGSKVAVSVSPQCGDGEDENLDITWMLRQSPCSMEYETITEDFNKNENKGSLETFLKAPVTFLHMPYDTVQLMEGNLQENCAQQNFKLEADPDKKPITWKVPKLPENPSASPAKSVPQEKALPESSAVDIAMGRRKREEDQARESNQSLTTVKPMPNEEKEEGAEQGNENQQTVMQTTTSFFSSTPFEVMKDVQVHHEPFVKTWMDSNYLFVIRFKSSNPQSTFTAEVTIRTFYGDNNYISALDYPLVVFYGVMGLIYIVFGVVWLLLLACNWRDLLRVQYWIGGVIVLGMLEKAVFFAEYENINNTGVSGSVTLVFAELVSCLKRTLARMLVIIVSLGFGIVKPRLGQTFHKVLLVGGLFFIFSAIEGYLRATSSKVGQSNEFLMAAVPLAVLDAVICWWIFSSLIQTTRTLRLRRNIVKLSLYRHFTNALIFNVLASVAYMVWFLTLHKFNKCVKDWRQLWVDEAFWHVLFVVLLFIIIILWRPTANNQRYAFSPLLDSAEEELEEEDGMMNEAFEGMKMRGGKHGAPKQRDSKNKMEEDLKWVEENIPSSVADKALPTILDSDEEMMTTKLEMSKME